ncbi:Beta-glucosidase-like glycosyl hydrolase precursor [Sphingobium herbicidovorans NBRC 16415]|uniref:beta-glucosidase n=1 Tax=Sphingobium herbicidovorans (strain ATCC 700291 / DSM 11019 / CCUG 56400 / KCTC 2939 / LMG 18315 / NBRC 16415 / MH) TaxID=1219045 RepID=A0A086PDA1_SPHHM|nr:glycoside hydrolase family 3 N-terminal domain-containing protein [Sphingobium herbicidovorans]KFG91369.1 Beta-glucosidase-like glycosyl hydrolase precursor [Sphingobium herbicidovorans NBRC 16415]
MNHKIQLTRRTLLGSTFLIMAAPAAAAVAGATYRDPNAPVADRIRDLLSRMTLEEKVAQLQCIWFGKGKMVNAATGAFDPEKAKAAFPNGIGQLARPSDNAGLKEFGKNRFRTSEDAVTFLNAVQRFLVEQTRLGIPALFHEETAHGLAVKDATMLPTPTGLGATWDPELVEQGFALVGRQARLRGITLGLSPVIDLLRDPRWGRSEEFFGEDPFHVGEMGAAAVRGLQGRTRPIASDRIFSVLKHYVHGTPQNGLNVGPADMSERMLREIYLPPFQHAIKAAHAAAVMPAYNEVAGVPAHASTELLQQTGRGLMSFGGPYFSDYNGVRELASVHRIAAGAADAAVLAITAGVDVDMPEGASYAHLPPLVREGKVSEAVIDAAVSRVLALKFEAGLFERPYADPVRAARVLKDPAGPTLARRLAQRSMVLLKNDGLLPLDAKQPRRIAIIGPNSTKAMRGGYSGEPAQEVGVLEGIRAAVGKSVVIEQSDGVWITQPGEGAPETVMIRTVPPADNERRIADAVAVAKRADLVILCVGDNEAVTREAVTGSLPGDRNSLGLYGDQDALVEAVLGCDKPVVAVLINGRPLTIGKLANGASALIEAWYPGEQGGHAVADVLFGKVNPGGKLPVTFPASVGELPAWYNRHPSADKVPYVEGKRAPLFPFGFGLSYTSFEVSEPRLPAANLKAGETVRVEVDVTNTGSREGDEVVQIYIRDMIASAPRATLELKAFRRITLGKGERRTVVFDLAPDAFSFWDRNMEWRIEPGEFKILAGNSSTNLKETTLTLT